MPIAFAFLDDEGFLYEYLGNNTYSSESVLSIGDPNAPTTNVAINSTSVTVGDPSSKVSMNSSSITCSTLVLSVMPTNCVDDAAALSAGIPVGGIYRNGSILMIRQS